MQKFDGKETGGSRSKDSLWIVENCMGSFCFGTGNGYLISSLTVAPVDTDNRLVFHGYFVGIETIIRCRILDLQHKLECQKGRATQYRDIIWIRDEL